MAKKLSRDKQRVIHILNDIEQNVLKNEDYKRHVKEVALETGLPEEAIDTVLSHFFLEVPKVIYSKNQVNKRITFFGFFSLEIKKKFNNLINRNNAKQ